MSPVDDTELRERAVELLARREHSTGELAAKLARKGFPADAIAAALARLESEGLLSDSRFAEAFAESRQARGVGPLRIDAELGERGVCGDIRERVCAHRDRRWWLRAAEARRKRFGDALPDGFPERARQARFLARRGFTAEQAADAVGGIEPDPD